MVVDLANKIADYLISNNIIETNEKAVYKYGAELFLATVINSIIFIIVATIFNRFIETLFFLFPFILLRSIIGGYHADTHEKCFCLFLFTQLSLYLFLAFIPTNIFQYAIFLNIIVSTIINFTINKKNHKNKRISKYIKNILVFENVVLFSFSALSILILFKHPLFAFCFSYGILTAYLGVVLDKYLLRKEREK